MYLSMHAYAIIVYESIHFKQSRNTNRFLLQKSILIKLGFFERKNKFQNCEREKTIIRKRNDRNLKRKEFSLF